MSINLYPLLRPLLFRLDAEFAHHLAIGVLKYGLLPKAKPVNDPVLRAKVCGLDFPHPVGLAAGFDKQAVVIAEAFNLGFGFTEIGGVVPLPQTGNPKPRIFRLPDEKAIINRMNFNSDGFDVCQRRVQNWYEQTAPTTHKIVGINIAKGDHHEDAAEAYSLGLQKFAPYVSFVTVNVSCPNEPDARNLEGRDQLKELLRRVKETHQALEKKPLLFVKISPDQTEKQAQDIATVALESGIDGMIVSNTTATRPATLTSATAKERGGLSGKPIFDMSTKILASMYQLTQGKIPLIGCGGIFSGADAYAKIRAGASLVQIYTALVYEGPYVATRIATELAMLLKRDGFASVADAVGTGAVMPPRQ